ncbi:MAG: UDP-N-acetylglucosamine 1-carboxyvinyltransferase [Candidatus Omnitrophica bacterium]|nr:UDP-N-acetylglucosamine 1-carboxyvinyltransferase [Candidatus Omnitrophota bacterium]
MDKLVINGGHVLKGEIDISGAKNAALPIIAATLLTDEECIIKNVPDLKDISTMQKIFEYLGVKLRREKDVLVRESGSYNETTAPYDIVSTMRASICVLGPLLAKKSKANVSFPGGCVIGPRPIDLHLKGLRALGADISVEEGYIIANTKQLKGKDIYLGGHFGSSVLATANLIMAATLAKGTTVIHNAAAEPEIQDLGNFLLKMGAQIQGIGAHTITIQGVKKLHGAQHTIIPDRIETGTYMAAAAITNGDLLLRNTAPSDIMAITDKFREIGCLVDIDQNTIRIRRKNKMLKAGAVTTLTYPGFPTDMQAQIMSLLSISPGISVITEKIYPERFIHISELNRLGANIILEGCNAIVKGVKSLSGTDVMASDLRASAALILAGLVARGKTTVHRVYHLDRGYENLEKKLKAVGADIKREKE